MKASDLFVRCLEAEGVTHIFGVPGEENADVMISLMDSSIRFVLCRHEQAAAFAADAWGRLTGKAGVCLGTLGPGATNLVTGVADANMDRSPVVCIIGQGSTRRLHKESHQNMDSVAMFGPITKWAHTIWDAGTVPEVVRKAFKTAEAEKPGATLVEFPEDVAKEESGEPPMAAVRTRRPGADHNEALNHRFDDEGRLPLFDIRERRRLRDAIHDDLTMERGDASFPMKPQKILWDVREHLGPDDIVLSDVGAHKMWIARYYQCETANTCLISNGFCSMGFALPGAMGAKLAHPDRKVLAIAGDAGFLMNVQDLETLVRYRQNVVIMIWADGEYGLIKWKQQNQFDGRHSDLAFDNPDFELLAKSFGAWGRTLTGAGQLPDALDEAFRQPGPALLAVPVDYGENVKLSQRLGNLNFSI